MAEFVISIADAAVEVRCGFGSTREYFKKYLSGCSPEAVAAVTEADLVREQLLLDEEADRDGLKRRVFTGPFLERAVIQRKTAAYLLRQGVLLLHGSTVAADGRAYLFTAGCGVGKSTHTRLWRELLGERAVMVNDDRAFLRPSPEGMLAYGSPWSGKHGIDSNICVPLAGICILERGSENRIARAAPEEVLPMLLSQAYHPEEEDAPQVAALTRSLAAGVPLWKMQCTKSLEAAQLAFETMSK